MDCNFLKKDAYSLVELAIAMGIVAVLTTALLPLAVRAIEIKAAEKTITEVGIIQTAAQKYYTEHRAWPNDLTQLQTLGYLSPLWSLNNPWNYPYGVEFAEKTMTVKIKVPLKMTGMLNARLSQASTAGDVVSVVAGVSDKNIIAAGVIVAWSGTIADIPLGWVLCDGQNGTPDLRNKFIVGAKQDDNGAAKTNIMGVLDQTGGSISHNHGGQSGGHVLTITEMPSHHHEVMINDATTNGPIRYPETAGVASLKPYSTSNAGGNQAHAHAIASDNNVPPFYALAFIMKI